MTTLRSLPRLATATIVVALVLLLSTAGAGHARGLASTDVIDLGVLINMDPLGDPDTQVALRLAVADVNAFFAGRGERVSVRLTIEGTGGDPEVALEKVRRLAADGHRVIIGPESSPEVQAVKPFTDASDLTVLSHCSSAPALAIPGDSVYRMVPSDERQGAAIARLVSSHGTRVIAPIWRGDVFGDGQATFVRREFTGLGGAVTPGVRFTPDSTDLSAELAALAAQVEQARASFGSAVAVVFLGFGPDGAVALAQAGEFPALEAVSWYGSDGTAISREILTDPRAAGFAVRVGFFNTLFAEVHTEAADAVRASITAETGSPVYFCAMAAYDAVWLAALTATVASPDDAAGFKRALVASAGSVVGVTGPTTFDAAGDRADAAYDVWVIEERGGVLGWTTIGSTIRDLAGAGEGASAISAP